jgi:biopolymer transport protein ExbD
VKKFSRSHHSSLNELNITPLLDLAFVLLVIFIITTPQMVNDLELNLPSGKAPPQGAKAKLNYVIVNREGAIKLNDRSMTLPELKMAFMQMHAKDTNTPIVVKGDADVDYQNIVNVLDLLRQTDITKVGLATEVQSAPGQ